MTQLAQDLSDWRQWPKAESEGIESWREWSKVPEAEVGSWRDWRQAGPVPPAEETAIPSPVVDPAAGAMPLATAAQWAGYQVAPAVGAGLAQATGQIVKRGERAAEEEEANWHRSRNALDAEIAKFRELPAFMHPERGLRGEPEYIARRIGELKEQKVALDRMSVDGKYNPAAFEEAVKAVQARGIDALPPTARLAARELWMMERLPLGEYLVSLPIHLTGIFSSPARRIEEGRARSGDHRIVAYLMLQAQEEQERGFLGRAWQTVQRMPKYLGEMLVAGGLGKVGVPLVFGAPTAVRTAMEAKTGGAEVPEALAAGAAAGTITSLLFSRLPARILHPLGGRGGVQRFVAETTKTAGLMTAAGLQERLLAEAAAGGGSPEAKAALVDAIRGLPDTAFAAALFHLPGAARGLLGRQYLKVEALKERGTAEFYVWTHPEDADWLAGQDRPASWREWQKRGLPAGVGRKARKTFQEALADVLRTRQQPPTEGVPPSAQETARQEALGEGAPAVEARPGEPVGPGPEQVGGRGLGDLGREQVPPGQAAAEEIGPQVAPAAPAAQAAEAAANSAEARAKQLQAKAREFRASPQAEEIARQANQASSDAYFARQAAQAASAQPPAEPIAAPTKTGLPVYEAGLTLEELRQRRVESGAILKPPPGLPVAVRKKLRQARTFNVAEATPFPEYENLSREQRLEIEARGWRFSTDRQGNPVLGKSSEAGPLQARQRAAEAYLRRKAAAEPDPIAQMFGAEYGVEPRQVEKLAGEMLDRRLAAFRERESAKAAVRKATGLTAGDIARLENAGYDVATLPERLPPATAAKMQLFGKRARTLAGEYPELGLSHPDNMQADHAAELWQVLREGQREEPKLSAQLFDAAAQELARQTEGEEIDFAFGANVLFERTAGEPAPAPDFSTASARARGGFAPGPAKAAQIKPTPLPELVQLCEMLLGSPPFVKKLREAAVRGKFDLARRRIIIKALTAKDAVALAQVVGHELGHAINWLPEETMASGNILGRLASLRNYRKGWLAGEPGGPGPLTPKERQRLRNEAAKLLRKGAWVEIEEEIIERFDVSPDDILAIWNSLDQSKLNPDLVRYIKTLGDLEKLSIVKEAMKGIVPDELKQFAKEIRTKTGKITRQRVWTKGTAAEIAHKYHELLKAEILNRQLLSAEIIRGELINLTRWWKPFDPRTVSRAHLAYRLSGPELYADALSVFFNAPAELAARAPEFYRGLSNWIGEKPEVQRAVLEIQALLNAEPPQLAAARWVRMQEDHARGDDAIMQAEKARWERAKSTLHSVMQTLSQAVLTSYAPGYRAARKARGVAPEEARAAYYALSELTMRGNPQREMLERIHNEVERPLAALGLDRTDLGPYLQLWEAMHQAGDQAFPKGYLPHEALQTLEQMKQASGPERWAALEAAGRQFHEIVWPVIEEGLDSGALPQSRREELQANKYTYATHTVLRYVGEHVPAALMRRVGTFEAIANPYDQTIMKMIAISRLSEYNRAAAAVRDLMQASQPDEITRERPRWRGRGPEHPEKPGHDWLTVMEDGRPVRYSVPKPLADMFKLHDVGLLGTLGVISSGTYAIVHPLLVSLNPGFLAGNIIRDMRRAWVNMAALGSGERERIYGELVELGLPEAEARAGALPQSITLGQLLAFVWQIKGAAARHASGMTDPLMQELLHNKAYSIPYTDVQAEAPESGSARRQMQKMGVAQDAEVQRSKLLAYTGLGKLHDGLIWIGKWQEAASKMAAWELLADKAKLAEAAGATPLSLRERADRVRRYVGTPNFRERGLATSFTNSIWLYSNVRLQGLAADLEIALGKYGRRAAFGWWTRQMLANVLPTIAFKAGQYGLYGAGVAAILRKMPKYFVENYDVIPVGIYHGTDDDDDQDDKLIALTIPKDDTGKILSRVLGNVFDAVGQGTGLDTKYASPRDALAAMVRGLKESVMPSATPPLQMLGGWSDYAAGVNPRDPYFETTVVPPADWEPYSWPATKKMLAWTARQTGIAGDLAYIFTAPLTGPAFESGEETWTERLVRLPTGFHRLLRITNRGLQEDEWLEVQREDDEGREFRQSLPQEVRQATRDHFRLSRRNVDKLSERQRQRRRALSWWYGHHYVPGTKAMKLTDDPKRRQQYLDLILKNLPAG